MKETGNLLILARAAARLTPSTAVRSSSDGGGVRGPFFKGSGIKRRRIRKRFLRTTS